MRYEYDAISCTSSSPTGPCGIFDVIKREAGVWVNITVIVNPIKSGWHLHELPQSPRPDDTLYVTDRRIQTDSGGRAIFSFFASAWAGNYTVTLHPEPKGGLVFPDRVFQFNVATQTESIDGSMHGLLPLPTSPYIQAPPDDPRHHAVDGSSGYSMYGARTCVQALKHASAWYHDSPFNQGQYVMKGIRGSIPLGGNADNEMDYNGSYYSAVWQNQGRKAEMHPSGISFDFKNMKYVVIGDENGKSIQFYSVRAVMKKFGVRLGHLSAFGTDLGGETAIGDYWYGQLTSHYVCMSEPLLEP